MGTGTSVPAWVGEIQIMEKTGWTERELYEDVSLLTIQRMNYLEGERAKADKVRKGRGGKTTTPGTVREIDFQV